MAILNESEIIHYKDWNWLEVIVGVVGGGVAVVRNFNSGRVLVFIVLLPTNMLYRV